MMPVNLNLRLSFASTEMIEDDSKTVVTKRKMNIYTPPGYADTANAKRKYPVLYLLHGIGGDACSSKIFPSH